MVHHARMCCVLPKGGATALQTQMISVFFHLLKLVSEFNTQFPKEVFQLINNQFVSKINGLNFFFIQFFFPNITQNL